MADKFRIFTTWYKFDRYPPDSHAMTKDQVMFSYSLAITRHTFLFLHPVLVHFGFVQNPTRADTGVLPYSEIFNRLMDHP